MNREWPVWKDFLISSTTGLRPHIEGGLRLAGIFKDDLPGVPLVTYVTVVRNNSQTLTRTIESVLKQTHHNVEHIVLDGASTDGTLEIIKSFANKLDYFASEPDAGLYDALNKAIPLARGRVICVINSDDWLEPDAAANMAQALKDLPDAALILSSAKVDTGSQIITWKPSPVSLSSYFTCANCCHNAIYATRYAYESSGAYDSSYKIAADFKWIMRCYDAGAIFLYSKIPTVNYTLGGISSDGNYHRFECQKLIQERFPFLEPKDTAYLHYCYYLWRDRLRDIRIYDGFDVFNYVSAVKNKYATHDELLIALALPPANDNSFPNYLKKYFKNRLVRYPLIYSFIKKIYLSAVEKFNFK